MIRDSVFWVWPSVGSVRKWCAGPIDSGTVSGSFDERDSFSTAPDCVAADNAVFDNTFNGWRSATPSEAASIALDWDEDTAFQFSAD